MNKNQSLVEQFNDLIYSSRDRILYFLRIVNNINLLIAFAVLIYSIGFYLDADDTSRIFTLLEIVIAIFVIDYFIGMIYSFRRISYIFEREVESLLVLLFLLITLGNIFQLDLLYNLFLLLQFQDYRLFYEFFVAAFLVVLEIIGIARASRYIGKITLAPATTFIISFIVLILGGAFLLMMPAMTTMPGSMPFVDALFISASASCVTGLSCVTVASYFTIKGQIVILILIQLGGIGIVSFATFFATFLSQGVGLKQQAVMQDVLSSESLASAKNMLKQIIMLTFLIEAIGAVTLFFSWGPEVQFVTPEAKIESNVAIPEKNVSAIDTSGKLVSLKNIASKKDKSEEEQENENLTKDSSIIQEQSNAAALEILTFEGDETADSTNLVNLGYRINNTLSNKIWYSVFHSISAFCNAGFSLFPNGLYEEGVRTSYVSHILIMLIITFGSLGFTTIQDIFSPYRMRERMRMPWKQWSIGTQIAVNTSLFLIVLGGVGFFFLEQGHTLQGQNLFEQIVTSLFQSITTRTAGFNTVDMSLKSITEPTYLLIIFLMFIGAAPGSTGGGIKTTTFFLLVSSSIASITGKKTVEIGKRTISNDVISKAFSIFAFALAFNFICVFALCIVQNADIRDLFFEQISAFATVGLSTGITSSLNDYSKLILVFTMYVGRVGTLTLALALSRKVKSTSYTYPITHVMVG